MTRKAQWSIAKKNPKISLITPTIILRGLAVKIQIFRLKSFSYIFFIRNPNISISATQES